MLSFPICVDPKYSDLNNTTYPNLAKTVFVIFMIFVPILLLNMLIAMMGNTYAHVIEQSEKEWMKQVGVNSAHTKKTEMEHRDVRFVCC